MWAKKLIVLGLLLTSFTFFACENSTDSNKEQPQNLEVSKDIAINEVQNIAAFTVSFSSDFVNDFEALKETEKSLGKVNNPNKIYRWDPATMWHTWTLPIAGENLSGERFRAQQHLNAQGEVIKKAQDASGFVLYYVSKGKYGFVDESPSGTEWLHTIGDKENPLVGGIVNGAFVMTGSGTYHKIWTGYYKANDEDPYELTTIDNGVDVMIDQLTATRDANGNDVVRFIGNIHFVFGTWTADLSSDGGEMITGQLKNQGVVVKDLAYPVADLVAMGKTLLP